MTMTGLKTKLLFFSYTLAFFSALPVFKQKRLKLVYFVLLKQIVIFFSFFSYFTFTCIAVCPKYNRNINLLQFVQNNKSKESKFYR